MIDNGSGPRVFTVQEASKILRLSRGATYEAVRTGEIPSIKIGRRILVPASGLARLLGEQTDDIKRLEGDRPDRGSANIANENLP